MYSNKKNLEKIFYNTFCFNFEKNKITENKHFHLHVHVNVLLNHVL